MNPYSRLIPRLNGKEIEERFSYYLDLVKKGIAGFIIFGGEMETVRSGLRELRKAAARPLIVASDLEQGLGQQVEGGTVFPPAMAIAAAMRGVQRNRAVSMLHELYTAFAQEAWYAGINVILAPVLDINTNPDNPIIATRAFGEDPDSVSFFGCEMVKVLQQRGILACGKHFPGHGDTETDSHISLPVIRKDLLSLECNEFLPFEKAIREGVHMIMLGHLGVPALDPSGRPASLSEKAVMHLRARMGFNGTVITDAMNMGGVGQFTEDEASLMALDAGVDLILHPSDPHGTASYLSTMNRCPQCNPSALHGAALMLKSDEAKRDVDISPDFAAHHKLSDKLAGMAVTVQGEKPPHLAKPFVIILREDDGEKGIFFLDALRKRYPDFGHIEVIPGGDIPWRQIPGDRDLLVAVFSQVRAWKGRTAEWLRRAIGSLDGNTRAFISFGNPYVLRNVLNAPAIYAYWDSRSAQEAVAERLLTGRNA